MAPSPYPFGLRNATAAYASAYASAHAEPSGCHQRFALDLFTTTSTHTHADSSEEDEAWARAEFSGLRNLEAMRHFMAASDYYFGYSDSDDEDAYDPTRECFNVELRMPNAGDEDEGAGNRSPSHVGGRQCPTTTRRAPLAWDNVPAPQELRRQDLEQLCELQAKVEQDRLLLQQLRDTLERKQ